MVELSVPGNIRSTRTFVKRRVLGRTWDDVNPAEAQSIVGYGL